MGTPKMIRHPEHSKEACHPAEHNNQTYHPEHNKEACHPEHSKEAYHPEHSKQACHPAEHNNQTYHPERNKEACHPEHHKEVCHPERSRTKCGGVEGPAFKRRRSRLSFWLKTTQALFLAVAVCFSLGATDAGTRYNVLNHRLMCTCGCAEILGECNHVGCPNSSEELDLLRSGITNGDNDQKIFDTFAAKYGATVLAAPPASGFNLVAWIAPFAVFAAALLGTILLVRHWSAGRTDLAAQTADPEIDALRERIRRETGEEGTY